MRTARHSYQRTRACLSATATALLLTACATNTDHPAPTPAWTYTSTLTATPGPLAPEQPAPNDFEQRPEVETLRHSFSMASWAVLMDTCDSVEFEQIIDRSHSNPCTETRNSSDPSRRIGPLGFTPVAINEKPEGGVDVAVCAVDAASSYGDLSTGKVSADDHYRKFAITYTLSPLTDQERATVLNTGLEPPPFWIRGSDWNDERYSDEQCKDVDVVTQVFVDWKDTYLFARPYATPQTVPRDEMP